MPGPISLKKFASGLLLATLSIYLLRALWDNGTGAKLIRQCRAGLNTELGNADWGLMGQWVNQMAIWAKQLLDYYPHLDGQALTAALTARYRYLEGADSIYIPWERQKNYDLAAHLVAGLRKTHQSTISIEIAYAGNEDLGSEHRDFLQDLDYGISFIDLLESFPNARDDLVNSGWAMKPFAMLASKSRRTILVDADAVFLMPPDRIFEEHQGLVQSGTLLYHDRATLAGGNEGRIFLQEQLALTGRRPSKLFSNESLYFTGDSSFEADSGVVAMDKTRPEVFLSLSFTAWLNTKDVRDSVTYKMFHGDKETFWIPFELSGIEYFVDPRYAGTIGKAENGSPEGDDRIDSLVAGPP
ncbi:hypothetical protein DL764_003426 [Monosporascus ibericus]|uniref:Nucleotide-diphospho-sugar transferase domain-containing protein n=1 Tax=Monosporascus ibericus TaxID=155417 RepID=A0A4V1XBE9_9PEZI|nr:hypothetical protein DL764_003426 [Monosporascus ibericus]